MGTPRRAILKRACRSCFEPRRSRDPVGGRFARKPTANSGRDQLHLRPPQGLRFVPCDFETQHVRDALAAAGFDEHEPAFVSWLGVTQFLTRPTIAETLRWAAGLAVGSEILLEYLVPSTEVEAMKRLLAASGTRFETFFTPQEIEALLSEAGLRAEHFTPDDLETLYFRGRDDGLHAPTGARLIVGFVS